MARLLKRDKICNVELWLVIPVLFRNDLVDERRENKLNSVVDGHGASLDIETLSPQTPLLRYHIAAA